MLDIVRVSKIFDERPCLEKNLESPGKLYQFSLLHPGLFVLFIKIIQPFQFHRLMVISPFLWQVRKLWKGLTVITRKQSQDHKKILSFCLFCVKLWLYPELSIFDEILLTGFGNFLSLHLHQIKSEVTSKIIIISCNMTSLSLYRSLRCSR